MREKRNDKAYCIAWRTSEGKVYNGDAYMSYEQAENYCIVLNEDYPQMYHYPMHYEETPECQPE